MGLYLKTGRGLIHWRDFGGEGRTVLLVHGLGGSVASWDAVGSRLTRTGRVIALDLPGFGLSPPWRDWQLATQASAVEHFLEETGPATLVGNSLGGLISEMVATSRPDLVDALVLVCPATPPRLRDPLLHWPTARRLTLQATPAVGPAFARRYLNRNNPQRLVRNAVRLTTPKPGRVPLSMIEAFQETVRIRKHFPWAYDAVPMTSQSVRRVYWRPSRFVAMIREIVSPTLVVQGEADRIVSPTAVRWMASLRPDWELVMMEDTGHTPHLDAPVRLSEIIAGWLYTRFAPIGISA
ncbi:MAG: alpha/beta fold hydrolase [Acidimicrobiia bacterium]